MGRYVVERDKDGKPRIVDTWGGLSETELKLKASAKKYRETHKEPISKNKKLYYQMRAERIKASNKVYYEANKEELLYKNKQKRLRGKLETKCCQYCGKKFEAPQKLITYKRKLFCDDTCLGAYLVKRINDEVSDIDFGTETITEKMRE